jgi:bifunctional enzyme CysN/CysC
VELLRFIICGSVDDGKSTLLGRLLHDCGSLGDDELARLEADSRRFGRCGGSIDYSLLADGLEAEREQANHDRCRLPFLLHRGTAVHRRRRAGHEQYTRNLVTGASTADVAVLLADARTGLVTQTRRHLYLVKLLGVRQVMLAVNKMDLVGYDRDRFEAVREDFSGFAQRIGIGSHAAIPVSAVTGENLSVRSSAMDWYQGPTLIQYLESVDSGIRVRADDRFKMPVQWVNRPDDNFRGFSGLIAAGRACPGDPVRVLPSGRETRIGRIVTANGDLEEALAGQSVTLTLGRPGRLLARDVIAAADAGLQVAGPVRGKRDLARRGTPASRPPILAEACQPAGGGDRAAAQIFSRREQPRASRGDDV